MIYPCKHQARISNSLIVSLRRTLGYQFFNLGTSPRVESSDRLLAITSRLEVISRLESSVDLFISEIASIPYNALAVVPDGLIGLISDVVEYIEIFLCKLVSIWIIFREMQQNLHQPGQRPILEVVAFVRL